MHFPVTVKIPQEKKNPSSIFHIFYGVGHQWLELSKFSVDFSYYAVAGFWGQLIAPLQRSENVPSQQDLSFAIQSPTDISKKKSSDLLIRFVSP